ncbi:MAG: GDP-mannose 4,6-dehydratase, partial [Candidatus Omnitrophica bacterium]|nr:GDP-mannose 4,6-dehydratase [Candidatus Omnitrophota bacterium]
AVADIIAGRQKKLYLGNLEAKRDWGFAPEYAEGMWKILQQKKADDFVLGTGQTHSVREFVRAAFSYAGINWKKYVLIDKRYFRPTEVKILRANPAKAKKILGWKPRATFDDLVKIMVDADMRFAGLEPIGVGDRILKEKFPHRWWRAD